MTKIKLCGLSRPCDIEAANELLPEYIGFVFAHGSRRYVTAGQAAALKRLLHARIKAVGVFVKERPETIAGLLDQGVIDLVQLHGGEDTDYVRRLRQFTDKPVIQAFRIETAEDIARAERSAADYVLLDSGAGTGTVFDWRLIRKMERPCFLAGGLCPDNAESAVRQFRPYAVDVSSGIETGGVKDKTKMAAFVAAVRKAEKS